MSGAGWSLKKGEMDTNVDYSEAMFQFFSKNNIMKNLYKLLLLKSILMLDTSEENILYDISIHFAELYFLYKTTYPISITIFNGISKKSTLDIKVEEIFNNGIYDYKKIPIEDKINYIEETKQVLKRNVIGAFYTSFKKVPYSFDINLEFIKLNTNFKIFLDKNKSKIEDIIDLRIIEFFKISEKDEKVLSKALNFNYKQDYYIQINNLLKDLF